MLRNNVSLKIMMAALLLLPAAGVAQSGPSSLIAKIKSKISDEISKDQKDKDKDVAVIVLYKSAPSLLDTNKVALMGALVNGNFTKVKSVHYKIKTKDLDALENDPNVVYISPVRPMKAHMLPMVQQTTGGYIAPSYSLSGAGIGVAIIDSGVNLHPDLKQANCTGSRIVYNESFLPGNTATADGYGHGTHIAGIIAGNGLCTGTSSTLAKMTGIAPSANIINLRVLDGNGAGTDASVIAAINRAIVLKSTYNIRVINLSLGRPIRESYTVDPLAQAVESAINAGIMVVSSAGNYGRNVAGGLHGHGSLTSPGNHPLALTVGAMNMRSTNSRTDDIIASFSSKGPSALNRIVKPDLVAPGNAVGSASVPGSKLAVQFPANAVTAGYPTGQYLKLSGTSMAAPVAAGAAALLFQKTPTLTVAQVKARLMRTATKTFPAATSFQITGFTISLVSYYDPFTVGAGYIDILAALNDNSLDTTGAVSPAISRNGSVVSLVNAPTATSEQSVNWTTAGASLYGPLNVTAGTLLNANGRAWGDTSITGNTLLWGDSVIWGDSVELGDPETL